MLIHSCRKCGFEAKIFQEYHDHLLGIRHQTEVRETFLKWSGDENLKTLVVYAPGQVAPPKPADVIALFQKKSAMVCDFVYWVAAPRLFIVQFPNRNDAERVLRMLRNKSDDLQFGGHFIELRRKSDVLQNEWFMLLGNVGAEEGISRDPVLIELSDDSGTDETESNANCASQSRNATPQSSPEISQGTSRNENVQGTVAEAMDHDLDTGSVAGSESAAESDSSFQNESIAEEKLVTKISDTFVKTFLAKVKQEAADDKTTVLENLRWMEKTWTETYLGFHNKFWPICFLISNSNVKTHAENGVGFEASFDCECFQAESNEWLRTKLSSSQEYDELAKTKVSEFRKVLQNETECNRRLKQFQSGRRADKPILNFKCHIVITYNNTSNTKAELTIKNIQGKRLKRKMKLLKTIFVDTFREYERAKIKKWSAQAPELTPETCKEWTNIVTVE